MKKLIKLTSLILILSLCLTAVACSSYGKLEKAFTNEGYTVSQSLDDMADTIKGELEKEDLAITLHGLEKKDGLKSDFVLIIEFKSTDELVKAYKESDSLKGVISDIQDSEETKELYNSLVEAGFANGNCLVFSVNPLNRSSVCEIVKGA